MSRCLIISADDFGLCRSVNDAVAQLFETERITSAGILAPAACAPEACRLAKQHDWSVGVHWTLHSEWPGADAWPALAEADKVSSLLLDGRLTPDKNQVKKADRRDVYAALDAQYRFITTQGCTPDHADSHGGTLYGINGRLFFITAFRLCKKYSLPFRFAQSDAFLQRQFEKAPGMPLKLARRAITACGRLYGVKMPADFFSEPHPVAKIEDYSQLKAYYERQLTGLGEGVNEVFMHPALPDAAMQARSAEWQKRIWEYEYLKSGELIKLAEKEGFTLTSWREAPFR